jgi:transcriptional regulator of acetoin/glycerol metabolism
MRDLPPEIQYTSTKPIRSIKSGSDFRSRLKQALEQSDGNRAEAARLLGISRATLYRRLAELNKE